MASGTTLISSNMSIDSILEFIAALLSVGGAVYSAKTWHRNRRITACDSLRDAFAPSLARFDIPYKGRGQFNEKSETELFLKAQLSHQATAVKNFSHFVKKKDAKSFSKAWELYYNTVRNPHKDEDGRYDIDDMQWGTNILMTTENGIRNRVSHFKAMKVQINTILSYVNRI